MELQDLIISRIEKLTNEKLEGLKYRGIKIKSIVGIKIYWTLMSSPEVKTLFEEIYRSDNNIRSDEKSIQIIDGLITDWFEKNRIKGFFIFAWIVLKNIYGFYISIVKHRHALNKCDIVFSIDSKKYLQHANSIKEKWIKKENKIKYYSWTNNDLGINEYRHSDTFFSFPKFWNKAFWLVRSECYLIDQVDYFLEKTSPNKILLIEGDSFRQHIFGLLAQKRKIKSVCFQWGYSGTTSPKIGWRNMPFDIFYVWGEFFKKEFAKYNPQLNISISGHPNLGIENEIVKKHNVILFANQKEMSPFIEPDDLNEFLKKARNVAINFPDYKIRIRSHPDYNIPLKIKKIFKGLHNIEWHSYKNKSLRKSINDAIICISISSTVSIESIIWGVYPCYLKINNIPLQIHRNNSGFRNQILEKENYLRQIDQILKNYNTEKVFEIKKTHFSLNNNSIQI